ncbi:MAG TPA: hypothetical protein PKW90_01530, partial [Myxococcota bacterium]|nr:hypothetical protein [Myxococcota bacterium]
MWWASRCSSCGAVNERYWSRCANCYDVVEIYPCGQRGRPISVPLPAHHCPGPMTAWLCARPRLGALEWHGRHRRPLHVQQLPTIPNLLWWHPLRGVVRIMECGQMLETAAGEWLEMCPRMTPAHRCHREQRPELAA